MTSRTIRRRRVRDYVATARASRTLLKLTRPEARANPYPLLRRAQRIAPVIYIPKHNWVVTRYADAVAVLRDPRFCSDLDMRRLRPGWDEVWRA